MGWGGVRRPSARRSGVSTPTSTTVMPRPVSSTPYSYRAATDGRSEQREDRVEHAGGGVPVLVGVVRRVEVRDPAGPACGQRRYVADLGDHLLGGAHHRPRRGVGEREQEPAHPSGVVL